jgi:hypothetical protein
MRHAITLTTLPLLLLSALPAQAEMISITPEQVGEIFCISSLGNDMTPASAMLSDDLRWDIDRASERSDAYQLAHPGDKPPLGDGLPWRTFPDYADGCTVGEATVKDLMATVVINYTFSEYPEANYSNSLILLPSYGENGPPYIWRIHDIDLGEGNTLRGFIASAFEAYAE